MPCPPLLIDDLGKPERFHHMLRIFKPSSPMNLGSWALTTHGAGATLTVMNMLAREGKLPVIGWALRLLPERLLAGLGIPSSLTLAGYTGVLLGTTSIPVWYTSPLLGALFMSSSLSTGTAATALASALAGRESPDDHQALASLGVAMGAVEIALLGGYIATSGEAARPLLAGKEATLLGGAAGASLAAVVLDAVSAASGGKGKAASLVANISAIIGGALLRWAVVRAGRTSAQDREGTLEATRPRRGSPGWGPARTEDVARTED
jgi:formate-dependent nitrite reductase membrane component NrfD